MSKILIIEDDHALCETTADYLQQSGYEAYTAFSGADGIQKAFTELPDLILCDISMPDIDGYDVYKTLQESKNTSTIPFIFSTAKASKQEIRLGMLLGADDYLTKPYNFDDLLITIKTRLQKQAKYQNINEERFYSLIENSPNSIFICQEGKFIFNNHRGSELTGYTKDELVGKNVEDIILEMDKESVLEKLQLCCKGVDNIRINCRFIHKEYRVIEVDLYCNATKFKGKQSILITAIKKSDSSGKQIKGQKVSEVEELEKAVEFIAENKEHITKDLIEKLKKIFGNIPQQKKPAETDIKLTKREKEVLQYVCKGLSNQEIAEKLFISYRTVERHRTNIINKTNSKNIIEVIIYTIKNNLIDI